MGQGQLPGNANVCVDCLGNCLSRTQCIPVERGVCLEVVLYTIGGSGFCVLITMRCIEFNQADECARLNQPP